MRYRFQDHPDLVGETLQFPQPASADYWVPPPLPAVINSK